MNKVLSDDRKTQSNRESMCPLWFFHLYILSSATTALSTLYQGRLYLHIYIYIYIYHICVHCILPLLTKAVWSRHVRQCVQFTPVSPKMYFQIISIHILHIKTVVSTGIFLKKMCQWHLHNLSKSKQSNC